MSAEMGLGMGPSSSSSSVQLDHGPPLDVSDYLSDDALHAAVVAAAAAVAAGGDDELYMPQQASMVPVSMDSESTQNSMRHLTSSEVITEEGIV
jgi:hypothetical protein